jgi:hypothetical protein
MYIPGRIKLAIAVLVEINEIVHASRSSESMNTAWNSHRTILLLCYYITTQTQV